MQPSSFCLHCKPALIPDAKNELFWKFNDHRSRKRKVMDVFLSFLNELRFLCAMAKPIWHLYKKKWHPEVHCSYQYSCQQYANLPWKEEKQSEGLYVLVTGLFGNPVCWDRYIRDLREQDAKGHIFVPEIPHGGNCSLQEAAEPILEAILDYRKKFPDKKISLVGISNGARIVGCIERKAEMYDANVQIVSIAGIHFGSPLSKMIPKKYLDLRKISQDLQTEMGYKNERALQYLREWKEAEEKIRGLRERIFYASTEDGKLSRIVHSLPRIGKRDIHRVVHGQSHKSIIHSVKEDIISRCISFVHHTASVA